MMNNILRYLYHKDLKRVYQGFTATGGKIILNNVIGDIPDLQVYFENLINKLSKKDKVLISYHNPIWEPILNLASMLGLRKKVGLQNWLDQEDLKNILELSGFEIVSSKKRFFGITAITIAKPKKQITPVKRVQANSKHIEYSVSIIVPARNEEGNIAKIVPSIPKFGKWQEIIFVEGHSVDHTWSVINNQITKRQHHFVGKSQTNLKSQNKNIKINAYRQLGKGKADAVKLGFEKASGDILMIYDADMTVKGSDLIKFYKILQNKTGDFVNGNRLLYPMEKDAMQFLNKLGNKFFGILFTWLLGQSFKDTLCGTKALFKKDYLKYKKDYERYLKTDPFGDFALIFTAIKHNLKIIEIPVRYKERVYGSTNINRFKHGLLLFKMAFEAFLEFKIR